MRYRALTRWLIVIGAVIVLIFGGAVLVVRWVDGSGDSKDLPASISLAAVSPVGPVTGVTNSMLVAAPSDTENWLMYGGDYNNYRHSSLKSLNPASVRELKLAWSFPVGTAGLLEVSPIVYGGIMYITNSANSVMALEAQTGKLLWRYGYSLPGDLRLCCASVNRGVAISGDLVFMGTLDAHLIALDRRTGKQKWITKVAPYQDGYSITSAPLIVGGKVITGVAGGEFGVRGFFDAYDVNTGARIWRHYTVPEKGEPGIETWAGESYKTGGAPTWTTGVYDVETNTLLWTTGNPSPDWNGDVRAGDNLYSDSVIAVDPDTGARKWHYQFTPHDVWDYDGNSHIFLVDVQVKGKTIKAIAQPNRNGFYYVIDRTNGKFLFAKPYVEQLNWATGFNEAGRPIIDPDSKPQVKPTKRICPGNFGGLNGAWTASFSPLTQMVYVPSIESCQTFTKGTIVNFVKGITFPGGSWDAVDMAAGKDYGLLSAINVSTGEIKWRYKDSSPMKAGAMSTAGGVVFTSSKSHALAFDATTGEELWRYSMDGEGRSQPIAYELGGKPYVAVASGAVWGWERLRVIVRRLLYGVSISNSQSGELFVFVVDE